MKKYTLLMRDSIPTGGYAQKGCGYSGLFSIKNKPIENDLRQ